MNKKKIIAKRYEPVNLNDIKTIDYILKQVAESKVVNFMLYLPSYGSWVNPVVRNDRYFFPSVVPNKKLVLGAPKGFPVISFYELKVDSSFEADRISKEIYSILMAKWQKHVEAAMGTTTAQIVKAKEIRDGEGMVSPDEDTSDQSDE